MPADPPDTVATPAPQAAAPDARGLLQLTLTPGLGPKLIRRLVDGLGADACRASPAALRQFCRVNESRAATMAARLREAESAAAEELDAAAKIGARIIGWGDAEYPALLTQIPDCPPVLYIRGRLDPAAADRFPVAIVGSRKCSAYGIEQSERFAGVLAQAGLTIISGGARGIDSAAHRGSLRIKGRTVAVLGCGLAHAYPPENADLFDRIVAEDGGAIISELPVRTPPTAENFPARNRIISGLSLGVIVIEASEKSGALITARQAAEEHGREVMALPGRVDSPASKGTLELLKAGGAMLITDPGDVLALLEQPGWHQHHQTHAARYTPAAADDAGGLFAPASAAAPTPSLPTTPEGAAILEALAEPRTLDELAEVTGLDAAKLFAQVTMLEIQKRVTREGGRLRRSGGGGRGERGGRGGGSGS